MFKNSLLFLLLTVTLIATACDKEEKDTKELQETDCVSLEVDQGVQDEEVAGQDVSDQDVSGGSEEVEDVEAGEEQLDCAPEFQEEDGCVEPEPVVDPACEACEGEECPEDCDDNIEPQEGEEG